MDGQGITKAITPHKGGRTIKKSADVTPEVDARLREIKEKRGLSLGDLIAWAVVLIKNHPNILNENYELKEKE